MNSIQLTTTTTGTSKLEHLNVKTVRLQLAGVLATTESYEFQEEGDSLLEVSSGMRPELRENHLHTSFAKTLNIHLSSPGKCLYLLAMEKQQLFILEIICVFLCFDVFWYHGRLRRMRYRPSLPLPGPLHATSVSFTQETNKNWVD